VASATEAREQAREILSGSRYREKDVPRPFKGVFDWLGDRVEDVGQWFSGAFDDIARVTPGGAVALWIVIGGLAIALSVFAARNLIHRRGRRLSSERGRRVRAVDPRELEREADAAERAGEWERAVRLRFRAGVLRLDLDASHTTGEISTELRSPDFDAVGEDFDEIVYGGRPASSSDAEAARERWKAIV
jgi:hypothetical protein